MKKKYSIKQILLSNNAWWKFYLKHENKIRTGILVAILKLLSCKTKFRGYQLFVCPNSDCSHTKKVFFTCKSKACSSCGKKATELWIEKQMKLLPNTAWQHITFTMPCELWDFFWYNRELLNLIPALAANGIKTLAHNKQVIPGIFIAIHTFGRDLKRNVHIHLSTTLGGITQNGLSWKKLFFPQKTLMQMWRYEIITLFRQSYQKNNLLIPNSIQNKLNHTFTFGNFLDTLYKKHWVVHCSKPSKDHKQNVRYLARYIKRPPIAESKLLHYDGFEVQFKYLDHKTKNYRRFKLTVDQFIEKFICHIPDPGFRMIRYYGFLAHRLRSQLLPCVYQLIGQPLPDETIPSSYAFLLHKDFGVNPLKCILCGIQMLVTSVFIGQSSIAKLLANHKKLAIPARV